VRGLRRRRGDQEYGNQTCEQSPLAHPAQYKRAQTWAVVAARRRGTAATTASVSANSAAIRP